MSSISYSIATKYVEIGLFFYHKKIKVVGLKNIPKKDAVIFVTNHPNALLDALLPVTNNIRSLFFLSRASLFKSKLASKILGNLQMIPIYRKRDHVDTLAKNESIFKKCVEIMNDGKTIFIAAEGSHNTQRRVRELKKGFTYIVLDTFKKYPELNIQIVPIGLNYDDVLNYPSSASVYYGKPIDAKKYYQKGDDETSIKNLLKVVSDGMKSVTVHIEDIESYDKTINKLNALNVDYLNPIETNKVIKNLDTYSIDIKKESVSKKGKSLLYYLVVLNSIIPWLIWRQIKKNISEIEFISTIRFVIGITLFPLFYIIQSLIIYYLFGGKIAILYFITSILLVLFLTKTSKV